MNELPERTRTVYVAILRCPSAVRSKVSLALPPTNVSAVMKHCNLAVRTNVKLKGLDKSINKGAGMHRG